jgi:hypothetical protein
MARADQPGPDWMPMEQGKAKVLQSGYSQVTKLEADDGRWEGEGIKNGRNINDIASSNQADREPPIVACYRLRSPLSELGLLTPPELRARSRMTDR